MAPNSQKGHFKKAMNSKPTIYIIGTGGTIAGEGSNATSASYKSGQIDTKRLVNAVSGLEKKVNIRTETLFSTGSAINV